MFPLFRPQDLFVAWLRGLNITSPGAIAGVRFDLEDAIVSFLDGFISAVITCVRQELCIAIICQELTLLNLIRSYAWLSFTVFLSFKNPARRYPRTNWPRPVDDEHWLRSFLLVVRMVMHTLAHLLLTRHRLGVWVFGNAFPSARLGFLDLRIIPLGIVIYLGLGWLLPSSVRTTSFLLTISLDNFVAKLKTRTSSTFLQVASTPTLPSPNWLYRNVPIEIRGTIRLLKLSHVGGDVIFATLHTFPLDEIPPYLAVSYVWGSDKKVFLLTIRGGNGLPVGHIPVTKSCHHVLHSLAPNPNEDRYLWIDAVCINQENTKEKDAQVSLMGDIYRRASRVVLFPVGSTTLPVANLVYRLASEENWPEDRHSEMIYQQTRTRTLPQGWRGRLMVWRMLRRARNQSDVPFQSGWLDRKTWIALDSMLRNDYWQRAWIVQEIALARSALLVFGNNAVAWDGLLRASRFLANTVQWPLLGRAPFRQAIFNVWITWPHYVSTINKLKEPASVTEANKPTVAEAIDLLCQHGIRASQPRDRIFSLLALCSDGHEPAYRPTYSKETLDWAIYARTTIHTLEQGQLHLLFLAGLAYRDHNYVSPTTGSRMSPDMASLPSWAPDLSSPYKPRIGNVKADAARGITIFLEHSVSSDLKRLSLRGTHACTIRAVSPVAPCEAYFARLAMQTQSESNNNAGTQLEKKDGNLEAWLWRVFPQIYDEARALASQYVPLNIRRPAGSLDRGGTFYEAMVLYDSSVDDYTAAEIKTAVRGLVARMRSFSAGLFMGEDAEANVPNEAIRLKREWTKHWTKYQFVITDTGLMGWAPPGTRRGDVVSYFRGCDVPFILRRAGDSGACSRNSPAAEKAFLFYGDAWFPAVEMVENPDKLQWFTLV